MALFKKNILVIAIGEAESRIMEVAFKGKTLHPKTIFSIAYPRASSLDEISDQLSKAFNNNEFSASNAIFLLPAKQVATEIMLVPRMTPKEMEAVVVRDIKKKEETSRSRFLFDFVPAGEEMEKGILKSRILVCYAEQPIISKIIDIGANLKVNISGITSFPFACSAVSFFLNGEEIPFQATCFVHITPFSSTISLFEGKYLLFNREIPLGLNANSSDEDVERIISEVKRSILYFQQQHREIYVAKCQFSGELKELIPFLPQISQNLDMPAELVKSGKKLDLGEIGEESFIENAPLIGGAILLRDKSSINLLPTEYIEKRRRVLSRLFMIFAIGLIFAVLFGGYLALSIANQTYRATYFQNEQFLSQLKISLKNDLEELNRLVTLQKEINLVRSLEKGVPAWREFLLDIGNMIPETITLTSMNVKKDGERWRAFLKGYVFAESQWEAQKALDLLSSKLKECATISEFDIQKISSGQETKRERFSRIEKFLLTENPEQEGNFKGMIEFEINCLLAVQ